MRFAFISRHEPTQGQYELAAEKGIHLVPVGDMDAFVLNPSQLYENKLGPFDGIVVVHPAAAMSLCSSYIIGVFENERRAAPGQPVTFHAKALHVWDLRDEED